MARVTFPRREGERRRARQYNGGVLIGRRRRRRRRAKARRSSASREMHLAAIARPFFNNRRQHGIRTHVYRSACYITSHRVLRLDTFKSAVIKPRKFPSRIILPYTDVSCVEIDDIKT